MTAETDQDGRFGRWSCCYCTRPTAAWAWTVDPFVYPTLDLSSVRVWDTGEWWACRNCQKLEAAGQHDRLVARATGGWRQMDPGLDAQCRVPEVEFALYRFLEQQFAAARAAFLVGPVAYEPPVDPS